MWDSISSKREERAFQVGNTQAKAKVCEYTTSGHREQWRGLEQENGRTRFALKDTLALKDGVKSYGPAEQYGGSSQLHSSEKGSLPGFPTVRMCMGKGRWKWEASESGSLGQA